MVQEINIADTEWKIMEVLWKNPMLTLGEIRKALSDTDWSSSTIKTLVRRLCQKGAIGIDTSGNKFRYYSIANEKECKLKETHSLINKIYNGSVKMLISSLMSESSLTEKETKQLMDIINKIEGGDNK